MAPQLSPSAPFPCPAKGSEGWKVCTQNYPMAAIVAKRASLMDQRGLLDALNAPNHLATAMCSAAHTGAK